MGGEDRVKTIEWLGDTVRFIDQTRLPLELVHRETRDYRDIAEGIRRLEVRGAPAIGVAAAMGIALAAIEHMALPLPGFRREVAAAAEQLNSTRPTAVNLGWAVRRMMEVLWSTELSDTDTAVRILTDAALAICEEDRELSRRIGSNGATLIDDFCGEKYRQHPGSSSAAAMRSGEYHPWRLNESERRYYEWLADYVMDRGIDDPELARALERARRKYRFPRLYSGLRALSHAVDRLRAPFRRAAWRSAPGSRQ